ncbi:MAG: Chromosome partition protein Smc [Candidatus Methanoperedens nitroreducens]|uniref:Chromosome partition protein Smc n=1 Tax=Candidatus Methanoperedens nitratireducens TaxID=1392998 RepID=A0A0P8E2W6_9EURY|nr:MAG: Chromosome partition protein Smc [Candidatus Methanoperedens sp. BLZ1]
MSLPFFSKIKIDLLNKAIVDKQNILIQIKNQIATLDAELENLRQMENGLNIAINRDETGQHLRQIDIDIENLQKEQERKKKNAEGYCTLAKQLDYNSEPDETVFYKSLAEASLDKISIETKWQNLIRQRDELKLELNQLETKYKDNNTELQSLKQRKSQIPGKNLEIRERISTFLEIPVQELPFIGELLKVKDKEKEWEGAIERLLHSFGLRILVPEIHYSRFNHYVNKTDLRGKLVYNKVALKNEFRLYGEIDADEIYNKIELKPDTDFRKWLENELIEYYNYICCNDLERFQKELKGLTKSGLIKGKTLHEKNDSINILDRRNYILGWNNQEKIKAIQKEMNDLQVIINRTSDSVRTNDHEQDQLKHKKEILQDIINYKDFAEIEWKRVVIEIETLKTTKKKLEESSDKLKQLQNELTELKIKQKDKEIKAKESEKNETNLERDIKEYQKHLVSSQEGLNNYKEEDILIFSSKIELYLQGKIIVLEKIWDLQEEIKNIFELKIKDVDEKIRKIEKSIEKLMLNYKKDYPEETTEVDASIEAISEYKNILNKIEHEDLPRHQKRFKELLNENIIQDIAGFKSTLENAGRRN